MSAFADSSHKKPSDMDALMAFCLEKITEGVRKMPRGAFLNRPTSKMRPEHDPARSQVFKKNKKIILATQSICGICGQPVDKTLKYPDPMSPTVDHIIPCAKGGSDELDNLQLAHRRCNRLKSDQMPEEHPKRPENNRDLPQAVNWRTF